MNEPNDTIRINFDADKQTADITANGKRIPDLVGLEVIVDARTGQVTGYDAKFGMDVNILRKYVLGLEIDPNLAGEKVPVVARLSPAIFKTKIDSSLFDKAAEPR